MKSGPEEPTGEVPRRGARDMKSPEARSPGTKGLGTKGPDMKKAPAEAGALPEINQLRAR